MARLTIGRGIEEYISKLTKASDKAESMIKRAVWEGAKVVADATDSAIDSIPGDLISETQRQGLHDGFGLASMKNSSGFINTRMVMAGYNNDRRYKTARQWTANIVTARRVIHGTSHQPGFDFVGKAARSNKSAAEQAMKDRFDADIEKLMN